MQIAKFSWDAVDIADGYNLYIDGVKENTELITDTFFLKEGLEPGSYEAYATSVTQGIESDPSNVHVLNIAFPPLCEVGGLAMTTDFYTSRVQDDLDELYVQKYSGDGALLFETKMVYEDIPTFYIETMQFVGTSLDESTYYFLHQQSGVWSYDTNGVQTAFFDIADWGIDRAADSRVSSIGRDGRVLVYNRSSEPDCLQVLNPDMTLAFKDSMIREETGFTNGVRSAKFDACGNIIACSSRHVRVYSPTYEVLFNTEREIFNDDAMISSVAIGTENHIYAFSARDNSDEVNPHIKVVKIDLGDFSYSDFTTIPLGGDIDNITNPIHENSPIIDKEGNIWFTADSNSAESWRGLGRIAPDGTLTYWKNLNNHVGQGFTDLSYPSKTLLVTIRYYDQTAGHRMSTVRHIDLDTIDQQATDVPIVAETEVDIVTDGAPYSSRFAPGEYSVLKGVDA